MNGGRSPRRFMRRSSRRGCRMIARRPFLIIIGLVFACLPLAAQEEGTPESAARRTVDAWYGANARARQYEGIREELTAVVALGRRSLIPDDVLIALLDEAVSKGAPPAAIVAALKARTDELVRLKGFLDRSRECLGGNQPGGEYDPTPLLRSCAQFLRRGIAPEVIEDLLRAACDRGKNFGAALEALRTVANVPSLGELPREKVSALGSAILGSSLSPGGYTALNSMYIKGKLKNLTTVDITDIIISVLQEGKGLVRIEQELNRHEGK
jgi:hypothetical protein